MNLLLVNQDRHECMVMKIGPSFRPRTDFTVCKESNQWNFP